MANHTKKPNFFINPTDPKQFFKDNARNRGLTTPKTPSRAQMIMDKDMQDRFNNYDDQPTQLGNANEDNTLAFILAGGPVIRQGFNLSKNAPSIVKKVLKKGKDIAVNFVDDAVNVVSSLGD